MKRKKIDVKIFIDVHIFSIPEYEEAMLGGSCHHGMAHPQVADGDSLQFWRVAVNILNKQSWTADKGWSTSLGVRRGANNSSS
jgi:hypothetical protein